jgi:LacI family transcriptional regulator
VQGVRNVVERAGAALTVLETGSNAERGAEIVANWLERNPRPTAVFGLTNVTTLSVLSALARLGIEIPGDISLVGFDDYAWMSARKTALTAIRQPIDEMAAVAWERLRARMAGDLSQPRQTILNTTLQTRKSVARRGPALVIGSEPIAPSQGAPVVADAVPAEENR